MGLKPLNTEGINLYKLTKTTMTYKDKKYHCEIILDDDEKTINGSIISYIKIYTYEPELSGPSKLKLIIHFNKGRWIKKLTVNKAGIAVYKTMVSEYFYDKTKILE